MIRSVSRLFVIALVVATSATSAFAGTICQYKHRVGLQQYLSRGEYKHWMSNGKTRIDRTPINVEMPADTATGLWNHLIIRPDRNVAWQIYDESKTFIETSIDTIAPSRRIWEFHEHETRAVETLADIDTKRSIFWTVGRSGESFIYMADAWLAEEPPGVLTLEDLYPVLKRDLGAVAEDDAEEAIYTIAHLFFGGERMPMRIDIGVANKGLGLERLEALAGQMSPYARLPITKILEFELFEITEEEIPDAQFELPEGYKKIDAGL